MKYTKILITCFCAAMLTPVATAQSVASDYETTAEEAADAYIAAREAAEAANGVSLDTTGFL